MRSLLLKIHLYSGLLCSSYLIIFGVSSLHFNHPFTESSPTPLPSWERQLQVTDRDDTRALSNEIREAIGLMGWTIPWRTYRDDDGNLHFDVDRPGKKYTVHVFFKEGRIKVDEARTGFWPVVNSLHALMRLPSSPFMSLWGVYTEICTWVVLFSAGSGIYFWTRRHRERLIGWLMLAAGSGASLSFMVYVWWRG